MGEQSFDDSRNLSHADIEAVFNLHEHTIRHENKNVYFACLALFDTLKEKDKDTVLYNINKDETAKRLLTELFQDTLPSRSMYSFEIFCESFTQEYPPKCASGFFKLKENEFSYSDTAYLFNDILEYYLRFKDLLKDTDIDVTKIIPNAYFNYMKDIKKHLLASFGVANSNGKLVVSYGIKGALNLEGDYKTRSIPMESAVQAKTIIDSLLDRNTSYWEIAQYV